MAEKQRYAEKLAQVYFDRANTTLKNEEAPDELKVLVDYETKNDLVKKLSLLDREPRKIKGFVTDLKKEGFVRRDSYPKNEKIEDMVLKIVEHEYSKHGYSTWAIHEVEYTFLEYGNEGANLYLIWPKGDGLRYQIMDMEFFPEDDVIKRVDVLKYNGRNVGGSSFAYGSLENAYKTPNNLAVLCFQYHSDR